VGKRAVWESTHGGIHVLKSWGGVEMPKGGRLGQKGEQKKGRVRPGVTGAGYSIRKEREDCGKKGKMTGKCLKSC